MKFKLFICVCIYPLFYMHSQSIFYKDSLTILADSLHNEGEYDRALSLRKQAIETYTNASKDYQSYLKAKYYHTKCATFELKSYSYHNPDKAISKKVREQCLDSALKASSKGRDLYINSKNPDKIFQYQLQNRIYHETAYLGNWKHALEQAQLGYEILKDTLSAKDKTFVDLIYDIGYIYSKMGDFSKAVENYQKSLNLYKEIIGETNTDVAQAYNNIAVEYRNLGLRKKELGSLLKAQSIWEQLNNDDDKQFLYRCYGNLFYWYSYYGDFEKAEEYILKKNKLRTANIAKKENGFLRNKEEIYEDKLSGWYELMLHYSRKKDTLKTFFYADTILKAINPDKRLLNFETNTLCSTLKFYTSIVHKKDNKKAFLMLDKAIDIQDDYKDIYYTKSFPFKLYKAELLIDSKHYKEAKRVLEDLTVYSQNEDISNRFKWAVLNAQAAQGLKKMDQAKLYFDTAFSLLNASDKDLESLIFDDLKPLISFETIDGFLAMGDFYFKIFKEKKLKSYLIKASHRYELASKIYNKLYLGQRYNESLFEANNAINERFMKLCVEQDSDQAVLASTINSIENNGSKLTFSKYVFNNQRQQLRIPQNLINEEENTKAELNFYQNALLDAKDESAEKIALWKNKVYELKNQISAIQDSIKNQNNTYYQLNVKGFEIANLQKSLRADEAILKYLMTDDHLYSFLISKEDIQLLPVKDKAKVLRSLKICLNSLKRRDPNYQASFNELRQLLFNKIDAFNFKKLTIIPDGALNYFPMEAVILDNKMPFIGYAPSLLLYKEQKATKTSYENLKIGAFSASNSNSKLPKSTEEVSSILKIFEGKDYLNASKVDFLNHANEFNVLHLAMHSNIDQEHPEFSSLNFYGDTDNSLFISELYNETLNADMAVLSACDTGNGFYENGEGVISLSRAFSYAGVQSTVMSLWKVDDEATSKVMTYFYEHLKQGETKDEALKNAKLDYLKNTDDELLKHPYYWSGFVLTGNTDALVEPNSYWYYLLILPFLILILFRKQLVQLFKK